MKQLCLNDFGPLQNLKLISGKINFLNKVRQKGVFPPGNLSEVTLESVLSKVEVLMSKNLVIALHTCVTEKHVSEWAKIHKNCRDLTFELLRLYVVLHFEGKEIDEEKIVSDEIETAKKRKVAEFVREIIKSRENGGNDSKNPFLVLVGAIHFDQILAEGDKSDTNIDIELENSLLNDKKNKILYSSEKQNFSSIFADVLQYESEALTQLSLLLKIVSNCTFIFGNVLCCTKNSLDLIL